MRPRQIGFTPASIGALDRTQALSLLWQLRGANMQSTADQAFEKMFTGTKWAATQFVPTSLSGAVSALTAGGI